MKKNEKTEKGAWFEVVQPLAEKAGLKWRGRDGWAWDYHANVGFLIGYTPAEREMLIDVYMEDYKNIIGHYPESVGSWFIDTHSFEYMYEKYGIKAACICRDQWGTDGYSLWGGYYNQAYYPSRKNMFSPAQTEKNQINLPIFRMLGSDPIYQYDAGFTGGGCYNPAQHQPVYTLEPTYPMCGGDEKWVRWFFKESFDNISLSFGYAQVGQENSFGWEKMKAGLQMQYRIVSEMAKKGEIEVQTLKESGEWYSSKYKDTPPSAIVAQSDWKNKGHQSIWFYSKNYRVNLFAEENRLWIRDLHLFDEEYTERYLYDVCTTHNMVYDNLPIVYGNRWSGGNIWAGMYPVIKKADGHFVPLIGKELLVEEVQNQLYTKWQTEDGNSLNIACHTDKICISYEPNTEEVWALELYWSEKNPAPITDIQEYFIEYTYQGHSYTLIAHEGFFKRSERNNSVIIYPQNNKITFKLHYL